MEKTKLSDLISQLEQELIRLGYTKGSLSFYRRRWNQLKVYAAERDQLYYSEQLGSNFLKEFFSITQDDFTRSLSQAETQELRVIRMIGDFSLHHAVLRRYKKHKIILTEPFFIEISNNFQKYCIAKQYSKVTIDHYINQSAYMMDYLSAQGMKDFNAVNLDSINTYIRTLAGFTYKTVEQHICSLRAFFRYLYQESIVKIDFAAKMPMVKARKQTSIPSVWSHDELKQLIGAIDRGSPKGKRDYAIILIACRLGLRCTDIKNLSFENFKWAKKKGCFKKNDVLN
jgi:integrase